MTRTPPIRRNAETTLAMLLTLAAGSSAAAEAQAALPEWSRDMAVVLVYGGEREDEALDPDQYGVDTATVTVGPDDTLEGLLRSRGLVPDGESLEAVYRLNPGVNSAAPPAGTQLTLPVVTGQAVDAGLETGAAIALTLDLGLKVEIVQRSPVLDRVVFSLAGVHGVEPVAEAALSSLRSIARSTGALSAAIRERSLPIDGDILWKSTLETALAERIALRWEEEGGTLPDEDGARLESVAASLDDVAANLADTRVPGALPDRYDNRVIVVHVWTDDGGEHHGLRVYFAARALYGEGHYGFFPQRTSPSARTLAVAAWTIWAGEFGDPTPLTDVFQLELQQMTVSVDSIVIDIMHRGK